MVKILSQSGDSLADVYDVRGSVAGIDQLETNELPIVHEMGATVFSERLSGAIRRAASGTLGDSDVFDIRLADLPAGPWRVLGVQVFANATARMGNVMVGFSDAAAADREIPFFIWDSTNDVESNTRTLDNGGAVANFEALIPTQGTQTPTLGVGGGQPQTVGDIVFRGAALAFGAGTVIAHALIYIGLSQVGGGSVSNRGLPVPGW